MVTLTANGHSNGVNGHINGYENHQSNGHITNGINGTTQYHPHTNGHTSNHPSSEPYDLICVGFGPASLAIAIALQERSAPARVLFLERQPHFSWHSGMILPGAHMQISFIKDLATLRNPRSKFTFLNYLYSKNRLVSFTNLNTFLPLREEYNDYLSWCASHFDDQVRYNQSVFSISPIKRSYDNKIGEWEILSTDVTTNETSALRAKHVVIAVGGKPYIPDAISEPRSPRIVHSSRYSDYIPRLLSKKDEGYNIAIVGGGQSSAEIFHDLHSRYPNCKTSLFIRQHALKPSDDSPFVNEIFDPDRVDTMWALPETQRTAAILEDRATNYGVVRLPLLEALYEEQYHQKLRNPDPSTWKHLIIPLRKVVGSSADSTGIQLTIENTRTGEVETTASFDAVVFGTGYVRDVHETMLKPSRSLMKDGKCTVGRDYKVLFEDGAVDEDAGVWLQGCCEKTHGLSDTLLSILAVRSAELVDSIFGKEG